MSHQSTVIVWIPAKHASNHLLDLFHNEVMLENTASGRGETVGKAVLCPSLIKNTKYAIITEQMAVIWNLKLYSWKMDLRYVINSHLKKQITPGNKKTCRCSQRFLPL